jgi:tetratricopeptide (TPR) repeat protein
MSTFSHPETLAVSSTEAPLSGDGDLRSRKQFPRLLLLAVVAAVWGVALGGGFRLDDWPNLVYDPATAETGAFLDRLGWGLRPLLRATYFLDHALWGMHATGFLLTNLLLHAAAVLAEFQLAERRLGSQGAALAAALVFALQPANAEAVAYLSGRSVLLSTALLLGALLAHERGRAAVPSARAWRWLSLLAFVLAALARETALVYPVLLLAWETSRPGGGEARRALVPGFFAGLLAVLLFALPRYRDLAAYSAELRGPLAALAVNVASLPESLSLWFRPWALSLVHPVPDMNFLRLALGAALLLLLSLLALRGRRPWPLAALAAAWILIALAPTHGLIARREVITERHLYLAWVGPSLLAGSVWLALARSGAARPALVAGALLLLGAGWASLRRADLWRDEIRLWSDTVRKAPTSALAWNNLGAARREAGDVSGAAAAFSQAILLDPTDRTPRFNLLALEMTSFRALDSGSHP